VLLEERPDNPGQMPADFPVQKNAVAVHKDLSGCAHWKKMADGIGLRWSASSALGGKTGAGNLRTACQHLCLLSSFLMVNF
jgi:hypothetical protein